jgi:transcriptional regulator with XRE-family HTH domain
MGEIYRKREPYAKFKKLLFDNNIKQKELAKRLGKSHSYVNRVLNGRGGQFSKSDFIMIKCIFRIEIHEYF